MDGFVCGYCQTHIESASGANEGREDVDGSYYSRCFGCGMPVHNYCILRFRTGTGANTAPRVSNSMRLCYPWSCTECKSCWICGSTANEVSEDHLQLLIKNVMISPERSIEKGETIVVL